MDKKSKALVQELEAEAEALKKNGQPALARQSEQKIDRIKKRAEKGAPG